MDDTGIAERFFETYAGALLARDVEGVTGHYAVPALIEFPDEPIAVSDPAQTREFFSAAFAQYDGVTGADAAIVIAASTRHSIWADVTWTYTGGSVPGERMLYQLVHTGGAWKIAVLTPMAV